jgi:hypothetical protein
LCTSWTAAEPSPTADATRFMLPARTSPTANTLGQAGLELVRAARERPPRGGEILPRQIRAGLHEALRVDRQAAVEPPDVRVGPGHREHMADVAALALHRIAAPPPHASEASVTLETLDPGVGPKGDRGALVDAADEIAGHAVGQPGAPHQQMHAPRDARQEDGGLPGRVPASDHDDPLARAELRLDARGP